MRTSKQPVMSQERKDLLNLRRLPARLTAEEAALILGCQPYDIPVLEEAGLLRPLAKSEKNYVRHYAAVEVEALARDPKSLGKAEQLWRKRWKDRNHSGIEKPYSSARNSFSSDGRELVVGNGNRG